MCFRSFVIITFFTLILSPHLQAQTVSETVKEPLVQSTPVKVTGGDLIGENIEGAAVSLAIILLIIFLLAWLIRRFLPSVVAVNKKQMRILSVLPLGGRDKIMLVDVAGTQIVIGVSAAGINRLHVFSESVVRVEDQFSSQDRFQTLLQGFITNKAENRDSI